MAIRKESFESESDERVIEIIRSGSEDSDVAMEFFLEKYKCLVLYQARSLYLVGGDKDDLLQEGMIGLYKAVREYDVEKSDSFAPFANRVIRQHMCNAVIADNRKKNQPLNEYVSFYTPVMNTYGEQEAASLLDTIMAAPESSNPEELVIDKENAIMLESELGECLSVLEKEVYTLYVGGMDYRQIAAKLGKTPKAIDNALQRIRGKLSKLLKRHY